MNIYNHQHPQQSQSTIETTIKPLFEQTTQNHSHLSMIQRSFSFGNGYINRINWNDVLFSDEKSFELLGGTSQQWVQLPEGESHYNPEYMTHKKSHSEVVHMWGCFTANGVGQYELFTENLDAILLKKILSRHLLQSAKQLFGTNHWWYFQDNDPKHRSDVVKKWLFRNGVQLIDVPPYSGDLNPIENLWADMNRRVESRFAQTIDELKQVITQEWNNTSGLMLSKLVASMPKRCKAIVENAGHKTKY